MNKGPLLIGLALALALPVPVRADDKPLEAQAVDALNKAFGQHPGFRANHAKGVVVEGSFKASPAAAGLSRAALFSGTGARGRTCRYGGQSGRHGFRRRAVSPGR